VKLRPYQLDAIAKVRASMGRGHKRVVLVIPTGGGKTAIASDVARLAVERGGRVLWLAHRTELCDQGAATMHAAGLDVGMLSATSIWPVNLAAPVQVASIQTLVARETIRPAANIVIWDECVTAETSVGGKRADAVCVGDLVETWDGNRVRRRHVCRVFVQRAGTLRTLRIDGRALTVTDAHPIWTEETGWLNASDVRVGDMCRVRRRGEDGWRVSQGLDCPLPRRAEGCATSLARVDSVEVHEPGSDGTFGGRCPGGLVYNFEVDGEHNFFANEILTHNCHHASDAAEVWSSLLQAYPEAHVLGLTATPERGDGTGLAPLFTDLVAPISVRQLTEMGHLVPCEVVRPSVWLKAKRMAGNPLAQEPLTAYLEHARGRQGFLFARSVEEAKRYAVEFTSSGIRAACIHGGTPADERAATLDGFRSGIVRMISNVYVCTEGTDLPMASVCILARGAGTAGTYLQMVGRVLRPAPRKANALLIDLQGISHVWSMPEDERIYKLDGKAILRAGQVCRVCGSPVATYPCPSCGYEPELGESDAKTEITGDRIEKFARMIAQSPEQRRQTFDRWVSAARIKGHKLRAVGYKWAAVYGTPVEKESWWRGWPT
jgi:superfamily II DNA or RNA helicase